MSTGLATDGVQIARFVNALFRYAEPGTFASLRSFNQSSPGPAQFVKAVRLNGQGLDVLIHEAIAAAVQCDRSIIPAVFAPPICTLSNGERARSADLANGLELAVEIDTGDAARSIQRLEGLIGRATCVVESGGEWSDPETGEIFRKLHGHWRLSEPTRSESEHADLRLARDLAALLIGSDPSGKPVVHPLRWPGSWNRKTNPARMAGIVAFDEGAEIHLVDALDALQGAIEAAGLDFAQTPRSGANPQAPIEMVRSAMIAIPNTEAVQYADWVRLGYACWRATGGADDGAEIFRTWSAKSPKNQPAVTAKTWADIGKAIKGTTVPCPIGAGTVFWTARLHGWSRPKPQDGDPGPSAEADYGQTEHNTKAEPPTNVWPEPLDLLADQNQPSPLRPEHVPEAIEGFVFDTSARMGVDPAAVALPALTALSSVISDEWEVQPKQRDSSWTENARIWAAIVGDPSILKSPIIRAVTAPIDHMEVEARKRHAHDMRRHRSAMKAWKEAGSDPATEPTYPRLDRYLVESVTIEALSEVLRDDPEARMRAPANKVLVRQDELSEWLANLDRYAAGGRGGGDRGAYLRLFNGGRYTSDRIGRGSFACSGWSGCVLGGIQPEPIQQVAAHTVDDGLLQRFCYAVPGSQARGEDREVNGGALARYRNLFPALAALRPHKTPDEEPCRVVLAKEAHQHRIAILDIVDAVTALPDTSKHLKAALGKWPGLFARLALTFHLIEIADALQQNQPGPPWEVLQEPTARRAAGYMRDILLPHLLRADALMFLTPQSGHARWIAGYILARELSVISARDIVRAYRALQAPERRDELVSVMDGLSTVGWVRTEPRERRDSLWWRINPRVRELFSESAQREKKRREDAQEDIKRNAK